MSSASRFQALDDVSIIVVDDAKFTLEMLRRVLQSAGFHDIRTALSGAEALTMMRQRKANILVADWLMPEMDGLSLTQHVRQFDEEAGHYTYVILLTAREGLDSLAEAFSRGVDDFISKSPDSTQLLARITAAGRISQLQSHLIAANRRLAELNLHLEEHHSFDAVTGLGNRSFLERQLDNTLRHLEARGGGASVVLIQLYDLEQLGRRHGEPVAAEISAAAAIRLQQSIRPLDVVCRLEAAEFAVLMHHPADAPGQGNSFRRIHQALNLRAYKTAAGFISASAALCLCRLDAQAARAVPSEILEYIHNHLPEAALAGRVLETHWRSNQ